MSMITGCPACGTMFRVVPDQLKISDGWVRCGHCGEVFDASAQLRDEPAASRFAEAEPAAPESVAPLPVAPVPVAPAAEEAPPQDAEPYEAEPVDVAPLLVRAESGPAPVERRHAETAAPPVPQPGSEPEDFADAQFDNDPLTDDEAKALMRVADDSRFAPSGYGTGPETSPPSRPFAPSRMELEDADPGDMSFVRQARRSAFWRRPGMRVLLALAGLALGALLFVQYAVQERDRLAATDPSWRPWLRALCAPLGCAIGPPKRIEAILIDNSGFTRLRPDAYRLSFSLRNQSAQPVAIPALQLTLTDTSDQAVLQRVFTPRELGAASDTIAPSSDFAASLALAVDDGAAGRVAGYRLLAFYP